MDNRALQITEALIAADIPIDGVAVDGQTYRIDYKQEATPEQREQAKSIAESIV